MQGITITAISAAHSTDNATEQDLIHMIIKIQQFADDTTLYLKDKTDLNTAMTIFPDFANLSGLKMNKQKTEAMWLGREKKQTRQISRFKMGKSLKQINKNGCSLQK